MGKDQKDALENLSLKNQLSHLVHWLGITLSLRKTVKNPSLWKESLTWIVPRIRSVRGREFGRDDVMVADFEELELMDVSEIYTKRLNAKEVTFPIENGKFIFPVTDGRIKFVGEGSGTENIHFDTGSSNSRRRSKRFSWRIRRVSTSTTSRLTSRCR